MNLPTAEPASLKTVTGAADLVPAGDKSFSGLHAASLAKLTPHARATASAATAATTTTQADSARPASASEASKPSRATRAPKGETYAPVAGQPYEEIVSGSRNGMFINRSGNARDGEAFVRVERSGRGFHIYGTGADRQVVPVGSQAKRDADPAPKVKEGAAKDIAARDGAAKEGAAKDGAAKVTVYEDVPGRAFDEITSGRRNGMFVNRSGNARDGEAFVLVERARHEVHIYGTGKDRLVVRVIPPEKRDVTEPAKTVDTAKRADEKPSSPAAGAAPGSSILLS